MSNKKESTAKPTSKAIEVAPDPVIDVHQLTNMLGVGGQRMGKVLKIKYGKSGIKITAQEWGIMLVEDFVYDSIPDKLI